MTTTRLSCLFATALLSACAALPSASPLPTGPAAGDQPLSPFYRWDAALPGRPGVLLRAEPQPAQPEIDAAAVSQRILYTSTDVRWNSGQVPVSGTLYLPAGTPPAGGWPLAAWAHGTLGVADSCAPSWALHKPRDGAYINRWLKAGFAVVATDYQGLGGPGPHPYLVWQAESRSVLDSVRAVLAAHPERIANAVVVTGQSQGSGPAIGSALIARDYAPELRLLGIVATGVARPCACRLCSSRLIVTATTTTWTITSASSIRPRSSTMRPSTTVPMPRGPNQPMKARLYIGRSLRIKAISTATIRTAKTPSTANSTTHQSTK